jgi:hypothetical protein
LKNAKQPPKKTTPRKYNPWMIISGLITGILLVVLYICYYNIDQPYRVRYNSVASEMDRIEREVIKPMGGIVWHSSDPNDKATCGNGWIASIGWIDIECPSISRTWFVPAEPHPSSTIGDFSNSGLEKELLKKAGYSYNSGSPGSRDKFMMHVTAVFGENTPKPIVSPPAGKQWHSVRVMIYLEK